MSAQKKYVSAQKKNFDLYDHSENIYECPQGAFFCDIFNSITLNFGSKTAARGERDSHSKFNHYKSEPPMSAHKKYVSTHKTNFEPYDHS